MMIKNIFTSTNILVTAILLVPFLALAAMHSLQNNDRLPVLNGARDLLSEEYHFTNAGNQPKTFHEYKNKILLVDFFFTSCPVVCPKMTKGLREAARVYINDTSVILLSFSVDPVRDSAERLLKYAQKMNAVYPRWDFLTGDKKAIYKMARKEFFVTATEGDGGPDDFIHTDKIILVDKQDSIRGYYDGTSETEVLQLIKDVKKLKHEN